MVVPGWLGSRSSGLAVVLAMAYGFRMSRRRPQKVLDAGAAAQDPGRRLSGSEGKCWALEARNTSTFVEAVQACSFHSGFGFSPC